ncbi:MAG TPA: hypothetical protein VF263_26310 [Longimicrobiaceae bacterium]
MSDFTPDGISAEPRRRRHILHPIPPAPSWREEFGAVRDIADGDLAVSLWRALRNVRLWAETDPETRRHLFHLPTTATQEALGKACAAAPQLVEAFGTFTYLLRSPGQISTTQIAEACRQVYEWAETRSMMLVAVYFAEAAAIVSPEDPVLANKAGHICRRASVDERSGIWYLRAFGLAVRLRGQQETVSREESLRALFGYGTLLQTWGRLKEAKQYFEQAAKRAERTGRRRHAAKAKHELLTFAAEVGTYEEGERYAKDALDLYPIQDHHLPALAHDWAYLLIRFHFYSCAVPLLELAVTRARKPAIETLFWSTLGWAAAGAGRRDRFQKSKEEVLRRIVTCDEFAPGALYHLAEGARHCGEWDESELYLGQALEIAGKRNEALLEREATELLGRVTAREPAPREASPPNPDSVRILTRRFSARLRNLKVPDPGESGTGADQAVTG